MRLFDPKFRRQWHRYLGQCGLATVASVVLLLVFEGIAGDIVIASLGASIFIAFTMPHRRVSSPRFMIGGYVVGAAAGTAAYWLSQVGWSDPVVVRADVVFGALAIGLAIVLMVVTNTEHPPAASVALGLAGEEWSLPALAGVMVGIVLLTLVKRAMRRMLIDLL